MKLLAATPALAPASEGSSGRSQENDDPARGLVKFRGDGLALSPQETLDLLQKISRREPIEADYYSRGGVVEALEAKFAQALGKERAIFFPTGTLANHVALRVLAKTRTRALVPHDSHIYNDSGDCVQQLSQLNLVPLVSESATFTLRQVEAAVSRTGSGRVTTGVGVVFIESPVRRKLGELFDFQEMKRICAFAKDQGIGTHLDGARLYMASAYSGISPKEYASHFDTVYVSLWKYFNAASGAILAGSSATLDELFHTRRMFGGGLPGAWPFAAVALHYLEDFEAELARAVQTAEDLCTILNEDEDFEVERIPNGSNIFKLLIRKKNSDLDRFRENLRAHGILLSSPRPALGGFILSVNPTLNRTDARSLASAFRTSLRLR